MRRVAVLILGALIWPAAAAGQGRVVDLSGGYSAFVDEIPVQHVTAGGAVRWQLSPRVSVGPEVVFMVGPGEDRDLFVTGKLVFDFQPSARIAPYVLADAGLMLHRNAAYPPGSFLRGGFYEKEVFWKREGACSGGFGVRFRVTEGLSIAPELRLGWEPHARLGAVLTWH